MSEELLVHVGIQEGSLRNPVSLRNNHSHFAIPNIASISILSLSFRLLNYEERIVINLFFKDFEWNLEMMQWRFSLKVPSYFIYPIVEQLLSDISLQKLVCRHDTNITDMLIRHPRVVSHHRYAWPSRLRQCFLCPVSKERGITNEAQIRSHTADGLMWDCVLNASVAPCGPVDIIRWNTAAGYYNLGYHRPQGQEIPRR